VSLPPKYEAIFRRFLTAEYTTIDSRGRPITWPVTPFYAPGGECIDVTTGLGYPKKADDARANPKVALLFSDPTGSGLESPAAVLVQGIAEVDDRDLGANRARYWLEVNAKLPEARRLHPPALVRRRLGWYYTRIYVHVRPQRFHVWPASDAPGRGPTAVLSMVAADGFPFAVRLPMRGRGDSLLVRLGRPPPGVPLAPGPACLAVHEHPTSFTWQRNFQVRGDLVHDGDGWAVVVQRVVGGFELPAHRQDAARRRACPCRAWRRRARVVRPLR
jgi:hypothetical protein